jgi:hypothetical protein
LTLEGGGLFLGTSDPGVDALTDGALQRFNGAGASLVVQTARGIDLALDRLAALARDARKAFVCRPPFVLDVVALAPEPLGQLA